MANTIILALGFFLVYSDASKSFLKFKYSLTINPFSRADIWIQIINNDRKSTWRAGKNFHNNLSLQYIKALLGTLPSTKYNSSFLANSTEELSAFQRVTLPTTFDARDKWKFCKSLNVIRDQGECGSCWAVAAASILGDRLCISSNGSKNFVISAEEPLTCCTSCGSGCYGGYVDEVWRYFQLIGAVTGGGYNSSDGCLPYSKEPCDHVYGEDSYRKCGSTESMSTPPCRQSCTNSEYHVSFVDDHKKAKTAYLLWPNTDVIQEELFKNGPLQCVYEVYEDFLFYKSGVYKKTESIENQFLGLHSVKLIGWGFESVAGVPYWLAENSWNNHWGDNGTFKIIRGENNCEIESNVFGCTPLID